MARYRKIVPSPRLSSDDYFRFARVPGLLQQQPGVSLGLGTAGGMQSHGRLQRVKDQNGRIITQLVMTGGK